MKSIQWSIIGLIISLSVFLNIERLDYIEDNIINISSFVYVLGILSSIAIITFRKIWRLNVIILVIATLGTYLFFKLVIFTNQPLIGDIQTYVSFTEATLLCALIVLAKQVTSSLSLFEEMLETLALPNGTSRVPSLDEAVEDLKGEMHLSRRHERSLSVIVVDYKSKPVQDFLERVCDDFRSLMIKRYAAVCTSRILNGAIRRTDRLIELRHNNRFVIVCHETNQEGLDNLVQRIKSDVATELGIPVACGTARFPEEALTLEDLLKEAETKAGIETDPISEKSGVLMSMDIEENKLAFNKRK